MTHPKFDEVWQVSAYQELNRMRRKSDTAMDALRRAAQNVSDRRTLMDDGFWVSRKEMNALDAALAETER